MTRKIFSTGTNDEDSNNENINNANSNGFTEAEPLGNAEDIYHKKVESASAYDVPTEEENNNTSEDNVLTVQPTMVPKIDNNNNTNTDNIPKEDYDNNEINNLIAEEEKEKKKEINAKDVEQNGKRTGLKTSLRLASEWRNSYAEEFEDGTFLINGR